MIKKEYDNQTLPDMKTIIKTTFLLLALLLPATALSHDFEVDGIYYNINGNEVLVTYKNDWNTAVYTGAISIPSTVTYNGTTYSVTTIGDYAFYGCTELTSITIPNSVTTIEYNAFSGCTGLTSLTIPNSVTTIEYDAFYSCTSLVSIEIPNSVTYIGPEAFSSTAWYDNQPNGLVYAGLVAYKFKGTMPEGTTITLKEGTSCITASAFSGCTGLMSVTIVNTVTHIGTEAFKDCSGLTSINIPSSISYLDQSAFENCYNLKTLNYNAVSANDFSLGDPGGNTFERYHPFYNTSISTINIGDSVQRIPGNFAFGLTKLTSINIPNSVTNICASAFYNCSNLTSINIPTTVASIGSDAFYGTKWYNNQPNGLVYAGKVAYKYKGTMPDNTSVTLKDGTLGIAGSAFGGCTRLSNIYIPNSLINIGSYAFYNCTGLTSINIPNSVTAIGVSAFYGCSGLTNVNIPNSIAFINSHTFYNCTGLTSIAIGNSVNSISYSAFRYCSSVQDVYCYAPVPPSCPNNYTFSRYSATLHVPAASLAAYFTAPVWSNFENIVGDAVAPTGISVNKDSVEVQLGEQLNLTATVTPANASNKNVIWYSTNSDVATVENGKVTTVGLGECDIIATCFGMQAVCHISVYNRISMEHEEAMLLPNHMLTLAPTAPVMPDGFMVTSSDPTVAAARVMNRKVQIVGIKEGTTMITVGSLDGTAVPATCFVTVYTERGDLNCDGFINMDDLTALINYLITDDDTNIKLDNADFNNSGGVNMDDLTTLINYLLMN